MQILSPYLELHFISTLETKTTSSLVLNSISITKQLYNDLHISSNSCSLQLKDDGSGLIEDIINDNTDIKAILSDGLLLPDKSNALFTGILSNEHSWRVSQTGEDVFQIKIEDIGTRYLNRPFSNHDGSCIRESLENVILSIATKCNISVSFDSSVTSSIKNKKIIGLLDSSKTCKDILDTICYEYGLISYFNEAGTLVIKKTNLTSSPSTTIASTGNYPHYLYTEGGAGVDLARKSRQYSQARVQFSTVQDSTVAVPIYAVTETVEVPGGEWWDGVTHSENIYELTLDEFFVADKTYYTTDGSSYTEVTVYPASDTDPTHEPKVGDVVPDNTYYEYAGQASLFDMNDIERGKDILYVYPSTIVPNLEGQTGSYPGYVEVLEEPSTPSKWTIKQHEDTTKLEILIDNTQGGSSSFYSQFSAKGRIIRRQGTSNIYRSLVGLSSNSEVQFNYESEWIHDKDDAIALCELLSNYYLYCDNTYAFYCIDDLELGSVVKVLENLYSGLDVNMLLVAKQYTAYGNRTGLYKYTAQAISAFDLASTTRVEKYESPDEQPTLISTDTMYAVDDQGSDPTQVTGWQSTIPTGALEDWLWTRTEYTYSNGQHFFEYTVSFIGEANFDFRLTVRPTNLLKNRRRTDSMPYVISTSILGYTGTPTITVWFDGGSPDEPWWTGTRESVTLNIPYDHPYSVMHISASLQGAPTQRARLESIDNTDEYMYFGQFNIDTSAYFESDGNLIQENYDVVDWSPLDNLLATQYGSNYHFIDGDSFFNNYSGSGFEDYYIYVYQTGRWVPISFSTFTNGIKSMICGQAQKDVLSTIQTGSVTKSDFGYFNSIIADTVTADYIGSKEIELQNGGFIYAGDVDITHPAGSRVGQTGAGFCFDDLGNAEMANIRITGDSTIEGGSTVLGTLINYDVNGEPVFKTVKESNTLVSMSGSKTDGTDSPNAYIWSSFTSWLRNWIIGRASEGVYYSATGSIIAYWLGNALTARTVNGIKYYSTVPTSSNTSQVNGDRGAGTSETKRMYTNSNNYYMTFADVTCHPKTKSSIWGETGYGELKCTTYYSDGTVYQTLCNAGETSGTGGAGMIYLHNVKVPPGGYIVAEAGTYSGFPWGSWDTDLYITFVYKESDMFYDGINYIDINGNIFSFNNVMPDTASFSTSVQLLQCSSLSLDLALRMTASSSWPVEKFYRFRYTQSPGTSSTVTTSIFQSQSFTYRGVSHTVASITFSNSALKVVDTTGNTYEFSTASGYYYPRHSFSFTTLGQSLGAYMRSVLPTDDANTHNIGASTNYDSGNSQRWNTGFFTTLDVLEGVHALSVNAGWHVETISANTTLTDKFAVGSMRPYYVMSSGASGPTITMPGDSSQSYAIFSFRYAVAVVAGASCVARDVVAGGGTLSTSSYVSAAQPWCFLFVLRTA